MKRIILFTLAFVIHLYSPAGEIKTESIPQKDQSAYKMAVFSGEITAGDSQRLAKYIASNIDWIESINLNSAGGDLDEAIKMGEIIRMARIDTMVQPGKICASACFFIWINGADRVMFHTPPPNKITGVINPSKIGLHRPYLRKISNTEQSIAAQGSAMRMADKYLSERQVPRYLIDLMMSRGSNDIYWLTPEDSANLGGTPPDLEELYISHCKDNRKKLYEQITLAKLNENKSLESILMDNLFKINSCISDINFSARLKASSNGFKSSQK